MSRLTTLSPIPRRTPALDPGQVEEHIDYIWSFWKGVHMSTVSVADAKAGFSGLVDAAAAGDFVTITRHGKPAAVLVSVEAAEAAKRAMRRPRPNFGDALSLYPGPADLVRDKSPVRDIDFD